MTATRRQAILWNLIASALTLAILAAGLVYLKIRYLSDPDLVESRIKIVAIDRGFKLQEARDAGYSDREISEYFAKEANAEASHFKLIFLVVIGSLYGIALLTILTVYVARDSSASTTGRASTKNSVGSLVSRPTVPFALKLNEQLQSAEGTIEDLADKNKIRNFLDINIENPKWWPIVSSFVFFLSLASIETKQLYRNTSVPERIFLVVTIALIFTSISALYFARTRKNSPLTPWEAEARRVAFSWRILMAVLLSVSIPIFRFSGPFVWEFGPTLLTRLVLTVVILAGGWFAWRGRAWAYIALIIWQVGSILFFGSIDLFGLFSIVFCVQAYRYHCATKQFSAIEIPDILGSISGITRLAYAAACSQPHYINFLLKSGANVNERTTTGFTPLMLAAATNNCSAVVKQLVKAGADKAMELPDGRRAVDFARVRGASKLIQLLHV